MLQENKTLKPNSKKDKSGSSLQLLIALFSTAGVRGISAAGTLLLGIVIARPLSVSDFGLFSFCMALLMVLSMIARFGLDSTLLRFGGSAWHDEDHDRFHGFSALAYSITLKNSLALVAIGAIACWLIGPQRWASVPMLGCMLAALPAWALIFTTASIYKSAGRPSTGSFFEVGIVNLAVACIVFGLIRYGHDPTVLQIGTLLVVCAYLTLAVSLFFLYQGGLWPVASETIAPYKTEFLQSCRNIVVIMVVQMLANNGAIFFLAFAWSDSEVAIFSAPARLAAATILLSNIVIQVIAPKLSGLYHADEKAGFHRVLRYGCLAVSGINVPVLLMMAILAPWVMTLMGAKYIPYWPLLSIIAIGQMIGVIAGLAPTVLCMTGHERIWRKITVINAGTCALITLGLCYFFGAWGAAIGTAIYQASQQWAAALLVKRVHGFWTIPLLGGPVAKPPIGATS